MRGQVAENQSPEYVKNVLLTGYLSGWALLTGYNE